MIFGKRNVAGQGDGVLSCDGGGDSGEGHHGSVQEGMRLSLSGREGKSLQDAESIVEKRKSWYTYIHRQGKRERACGPIIGIASGLERERWTSMCFARMRGLKETGGG